MGNKADQQTHSARDQIFIDEDQHVWEYEYPANTYLPSCAEQPQNLLAYPSLSPLPSPTTAGQFAAPTEPFPYESSSTPSAAGAVEFGTSPDPKLWESSQWNGMGSNWTHATHPSVPHYEMLDGPLCDWSRDFEPHPPPLSIPDIPQSLPPTLSNSHVITEEYNPWLRYATWDGTTNTCASSPTVNASPSNLAFLSAFAEYDILPEAPADPQPSIALTRNATPSTQPVAVPYSEFPTCEPPRHDRSLRCQWLTDGILCGKHVMPNRWSVVEHLQHFHDFKPGEEKARETCFWAHCRTTLNKESLARHILTVHLKEKVHCAACRMDFAREDSLKRHLKGSQHKVPLDKSAARQPSRNHAGFR